MHNCYFVLFLTISGCVVFTNSLNIFTDSHQNTNFATRTWDQAVAMAKSFAAQMTLEEKCNMTAGSGGCAGFVTPVPHLNFGGLCLLDSPSGTGDNVLFATPFAPGIQIAASWDRDLFYQRAAAIGEEFRGKGVQFALGPMMNIDRNALHGRNWEGFGADPYLSGENSYYYIQGIQDQGVVATAKHYICNEQESNRTYHPTTGPSQGYSANLDDKTMHEIYLWPFADSVAAGTGSVMCSYNQVNGTQACQNDKTLNGLLKGELGFQGNVMSDWGATKTGIPSAIGGLDLDMPGHDNLMGIALLAGVQNGSISEAKITDMVVRILAPYFLLGQDQGFPSLNLSYDATGDHYLINRILGRAGIILLKNEKNTLPFDTDIDKYYSIYGQAASRQVEYFKSGPGNQGALYQGGGSGYVRPTYFLDPLTTLLEKARDEHLDIQYVVDQGDYASINHSSQNPVFIGGHCLVFISAWSSEGSDRKNLSAYDNGEKLVNTVAGQCSSTVVIVNSVSQLNLEEWIDHPNVTAVVWSGLPGAEYGPALADVLFGAYNPGGKLVFTLAKNDSDYGTNITTDSYNSNYTEGVFLDYRHFDKYNITPRYYFGYGLSYTTFSFASLFVSKSNEQHPHVQQSFLRKRPVSPYNNKHLSKMYDPVYTITFTITNTGSAQGSEVAQLYLSFPEEAAQPPKILRGFERVYLDAGESKTVSLVLSQRDISYWNVVNQKWTVASGKYIVYISTSANNADIKLQGSFTI